MLYQLPNGTTIVIPTELYLELSDSELEDYIRYGYGKHIEDPWYGSVLERSEKSDDPFEEEEEESELPDLTAIPIAEKLQDPDLVSGEDS